MENINFKKMVQENYNVGELTLLDFIEICDKLQLPVFEVRIVNNPFAEPHRTVTAKTYRNMSEYRASMPEWSARNYDYNCDCATYYLTYAGIKNGVFDIRADNSSTCYHWHFEVVGQSVVIHCDTTFVD